MAVASLFGGSACAVTLNDVQFGLIGIAFRAICQLAWQGKAFERRFADNQVAGFSGGIACPRRRQTFLDDILRL